MKIKSWTPGLCLVGVLVFALAILLPKTQAENSTKAEVVGSGSSIGGGEGLGEKIDVHKKANNGSSNIEGHKGDDELNVDSDDSDEDDKDVEYDGTDSSDNDYESDDENARPKLYDFKKFVGIFHKNYKSPAEALERAKLFAMRSLKVANSYIRYKLGLADSYLGLNRMSDWTDKERAALRPHLNVEKLNSTDSDSSVDSGRVHREKIEQHNGEGERVLNRSKRGVAGLMKRAFVGGKPSDSDENVFSGSKIDLRKTGCFTKPIHQGGCGSCYAIAAMALYEYLYCRANKKKIHFSSQFPVDCGHAFGMIGCEGGTFQQVVSFSAHMGFELGTEYPYEGYSSRGCPYFGETNAPGLLKASSDGYIETSINDWEYWLKRKVPLYVSVRFGADFEYYGGGVDPGNDCGDAQVHAMVLVGMGNENGKDYWLLRNSYGPEWGHHGYYKLNKKSYCIARGGASFAPDGFYSISKSNFVKNKEYSKAPALSMVSPSNNYNYNYYDNKGSSRLTNGAAGGERKVIYYNDHDDDDDDDREKANERALVSHQGPEAPVDTGFFSKKKKKNKGGGGGGAAASPPPAAEGPSGPAPPPPVKIHDHGEIGEPSIWSYPGWLPEEHHYEERVVHDSWGGNYHEDSYKDPPPISDLKYLWPFS